MEEGDDRNGGDKQTADGEIHLLNFSNWNLNKFGVRFVVLPTPSRPPPPPSVVPNSHLHARRTVLVRRN